MTSLPELKKVRLHREADFGLEIRKWIEKVRPLNSCLELKTSRGKDRFYFTEISDAQFHHAMKIEGKGDLIRVASGTIGAPDYIWLKETDYYFAIDFPQGFTLVRLGAILEERKKSASMTFERAEKIAYITKKKRG